MLMSKSADSIYYDGHDLNHKTEEPQEHYYSGNRHYHCIHTQVVITNDGEFEFRSERGVQHYCDEV
jgi:hypothetical protein